MRRCILTVAAPLLLLLGLGQARAQQFGSPYSQPAGGAVTQFPMYVPTPPPAPATPAPAKKVVQAQATEVATAQAQGELDPRIQAQVEKLVNDRLNAEADKKKKADDDKKAEEEKKKNEGYVVGSVLGLTGSWRNGFWLETPNKDFTFHLMGIFQYDYTSYNPQSNLLTGPHAVDFEDVAGPRRIRIRGEGTLWENIDYRLELEFANGVIPIAAGTTISRAVQAQAFLTPGPTDAWFTMKNLPVLGNVRFGNQKEPISLEHLEGFRWLPFLERSQVFDFDPATAFNNGFTPGVMAFDALLDDRMTYATGVFRNSYDVYGFSLGSGSWVSTSRLTWLPWYVDQGQWMMHLAASYSYREPNFEAERYRVRTSARGQPGPNTPLIPTLIDTGFFNTTGVQLINLEYFMNLGSLTIQAEYMGAWNNNTTTADLGNVGTTYFQGAYVQALYWLTGEYTRWDKKAAAPDRFIVNSPFSFIPGKGCCGWGQWQLCARASWINENSKGFNNGILDDLTLGINWNLNNHTRLQFNYDYEHRTGLGLGGGSNGNVNMVGMRAQVDF